MPVAFSWRHCQALPNFSYDLSGIGGAKVDIKFIADCPSEVSGGVAISCPVHLKMPGRRQPSTEVYSCSAERDDGAAGIGLVSMGHDEGFNFHVQVCGTCRRAAQAMVESCKPGPISAELDDETVP